MEDIDFQNYSNKIIKEHIDELINYLDEWQYKTNSVFIKNIINEILQDLKTDNFSNGVCKMNLIIKMILNDFSTYKKIINIDEEECMHLLDLNLGILNAYAVSKSYSIREFIKSLSN
jgi:hypothetical protein